MVRARPANNVRSTSSNIANLTPFAGNVGMFGQIISGQSFELTMGILRLKHDV